MIPHDVDGDQDYYENEFEEVSGNEDDNRISEDRSDNGKRIIHITDLDAYMTELLKDDDSPPVNEGQARIPDSKNRVGKSINGEKVMTKTEKNDMMGVNNPRVDDMNDSGKSWNINKFVSEHEKSPKIINYPKENEKSPKLSHSSPQSFAVEIPNSHSKPLDEDSVKPKETPEECLARVNSLLMELFPNKASVYQSKTYLNPNSNLNPVEKVLPSLNNQMVSDSKIKQSKDRKLPINEEVSSDPLNRIDAERQLKALKIDLKNKSEKIKRLTEHTSALLEQLDKANAENSHLQLKLKDAKQEIHAKDSRIAELIKKKKKKLKKMMEVERKEGSEISRSPTDGHQTIETYAQLLENENTALRGRESALLEAVDQLSEQNEDLIHKLKESMNRELELSSKNSASVLHHSIQQLKSSRSTSQVAIRSINSTGSILVPKSLPSILPVESNLKSNPQQQASRKVSRSISDTGFEN